MTNKSMGSQSVVEKASRIQGLILDVDGTLTDGRILFGPKGEEYKQFHARDGMGLRLLMKAGIVVVLISGRKSKAVVHRANQLGISRVHQGVSDKGDLFAKLVSDTRIPPEAWASVGDDLMEIPIMEKVGLAIAVADCAPDLIPRVHARTSTPGGHGAVREVCEMILKARNQWPY